ncbi:MAG: hypothetical protein ACYTG0_19830 [Planctomycetota bacterium]|jgi:hypothetical protein
MRKSLLCAGLLVTTSVWGVACQGPAWCREIDMTPHWDEKTPLENPHKGWYHHFPDNHLTKRYPIANDSDLLDFPGMDHLYMRLAWAYLEPEEGRLDWHVIDKTIDKWVGHGLGIAFRVSCRETSTDRIEQQYATPRWVMEAGAKGGYYYKGERTGPDGPWEPVFDDPVFLEKLEHFLKAFGSRYDGKPWLRYVDVGSIGDWGEGHTWSGSRLEYGYRQRKVHVDLYRKYFPTTQLVVSDDFVHGVRDPHDRQKMHRHVLDHRITYRDDSILVNGYLASSSKTYTVRSPKLFADTWRLTPTVLELEHYGAVKRNGNWLGRPGSSLAEHGGGKTGADFFGGALGLLHATYIGYHGDAREWLAENPRLTAELLNRCGYWYFLHRLDLPNEWKPGTTQTLETVWENRGVAPAYHPYGLVLRLDGPLTIDVEVDSGNQRWTPAPEGATYTRPLHPRAEAPVEGGRARRLPGARSGAAGQPQLLRDRTSDRGEVTPQDNDHPRADGQCPWFPGSAWEPTDGRLRLIGAEDPRFPRSEASLESVASPGRAWERGRTTTVDYAAAGYASSISSSLSRAQSSWTGSFSSP